MHFPFTASCFFVQKKVNLIKVDVLNEMYKRGNVSIEILTKKLKFAI